MSIFWLAIITFVTVDVAEKIGNCIGMKSDLLGLTLLAIGSSLPDCISSILVARTGKGDMAVSNALGSNIFDIGFCLGFSYFLKSLKGGGRPVPVEAGSFLGLILSML